MSVAAPKAEIEANLFQKYLIPESSCRVRYAMQQAGIYGSSGNLVYAHFVSVAFAVGAVVMSVFNAFSYTFLIPCHLLVNIVSFSPIGVVKDLMGDTTNVVRSLVFVSLGITFVVIGLLLPGAIFAHFAPEYYDTLEVRLAGRVEELQQRNQELELELDKATQALKIATERIDSLEGKKQPPWWRLF